MLIGLTGNIASGKSTVAKLFEIFGAKLFNSDQVAKQQYFKPSVKRSVIELLGSDAYLNEDEIDKSYINNKIFSNTHLLHALNTIIHPEVKIDFKNFIEKNKDKIIIKESALLFELGLNKELDKLIFVSAKEEIRLKRLLMRDNLSAELALKKIKSQQPEEEKILKSNFVIRNNGDESLIEQALEVWNKIKAIQN